MLSRCNMEKAQKYKASPRPKEEHSFFDEEIKKEEKLRSETRELLERVTEDIGQTMALLKRMQEEWEKGNLTVTPEISAENDELTYLMVELTAKGKELSRKYDEISDKIKTLRRKEMKEDNLIAKIPESNGLDNKN